MNPALARALALCALVLAGSLPSQALGAPEFKGYEVRVIRPRYVVKAARWELGAGLSAVMNQSFVYSYLASGLLTWHASETWAVEGQASLGTSFDREEKRLLEDDFGIQTVVLRTTSLPNGRVVWTPSYGKYHWNAGGVVYFDTFVALGAGTTGVAFTFGACDQDHAAGARSARYPTLLASIGQRHFLSRTTSLRIAADYQRFVYKAADSGCASEDDDASRVHDNVILYVGWSAFP